VSSAGGVCETRPVDNRTRIAALLLLVGSACGSIGSPEPQEAATTTAVPTPATPAPTTRVASPTTAATRPSTTTPAGSETTGTGPAATTEPPLPPETVGTAGLGDSFYPLLGNGGYDVLHYEIELDVDPAANTIDATTTLSAVATQDLSSFNLDLSGLDVAAVHVDGVTALFSREGTELTVRPATQIQEGESFSAMVSYSGTPEPINDPGVPFTAVGWQWVDGVIFTVNEPSGSMSWFPGNNHPTDKATFTFHLTVPAGATAAATGVLVREVTGEGATTVTWQMDDPMTTYLAAVYVGDFERRESVHSDGLVIRDYVPPDIDPTLAEALTVAPDAIRFYESIFGPYPFDAYGTLVLPFPTGYALENQTLSVHGLDSLDAYVIAHEVMHQWIGNSVTVADWSDIWMLEGFAFYLPWMYLAEAQGLDIDTAMAEFYEAMRGMNAPPPKGIELHQLFDFAAVYGRGGLTLHALRVHVGDPSFLEIMRTHYERSAGGAADTESFLGIVEELAGGSAVELTRSWLFDTDFPAAPPPLTSR